MAIFIFSFPFHKSAKQGEIPDSAEYYFDCSGHLAAQPLAERWPLNACWCPKGLASRRKHRMHSPAYRSNENSPKVFASSGLPSCVIF